ncbi:PSMB7 [Acanthosepion pharaonis]|uniref:Proteasome subunit beta n=1 Tax=Acanthosepion pharaonis TaxID=158019 RepID=A0A812BYZ3_ACAPH|nr:PSMB7 [Sepia pharaonis]
MAASLVTEVPQSGFVFENCHRNAKLAKQGVKLPKPFKTGTTIAGIIFKDGVVLGADTRATDDTVVADKNCAKIHYIADNIYCCGAGTAADTEMITQMIASQLELHKLNTGRVPRVITGNCLLKQMLFKYHGMINAALVLGGVDPTGSHLYSIWPHGSTDKLPYVTMGSGSLAAMAVFEDRYKQDMSRDEAMSLVRDAIEAGIFNDLGSGSNVDLCVITKDKVDYIRPFKECNKKGKREGSYKYTRGTTAVLTSEIVKIPFTVIREDVTEESMDTS